MDLIECISEQMAATRRPLVAVTVAAVPCPDTPVILMLHWHGFVREKLVDEAETIGYTSIPSSAVQLNQRWSSLSSLDMATMEASWELGAWDLLRAERPGCTRPGAESRESLECLQAFGVLPLGAQGRQMVVADTPDAGELLDLAARQGYVVWLFRPVHGGIWAEVADDATLRPDGTRTPPCPVEPIRPAGQGRRRTVYRFGVTSSFDVG